MMVVIYDTDQKLWNSSKGRYKFMGGDLNSQNNMQKKTMLPKSKIRQLEFESDTWKRQLAFMVDENIHMKSRLMELLKDQLPIPSLEAAEVFQNQFIEQDSLINLLRNNVAEFDQILRREVFEDGIIVSTVFEKHKLLIQDLAGVKKRFDEMKACFNKHILEQY